MRLLLVFLVALLSAKTVSAAPTTTTDGQVWTLENVALRVQINQVAARMEVLDKRSGYWWRGPTGQVMTPPTITIRQARSAPPLGEPAGWDGAGPGIALTPDMALELKGAAPPGFSARCRLLWDATGLFISVSVRDEKLVTPAPDEERWWEKDSVEFWLDGTQYAVRFGPWGANVWSSTGDAPGAKAVFHPTAEGYAVGVMMPAALVPGGAREGGSLRFALGVNDCDGPEGRRAQLYYPTTWQHSSPETFAVAILGDPEGKAPPTTPQSKPKLLPVGGAQDGGTMSFRTTVPDGSREVPVTLSFSLDGDKPDLLVTVKADDEAAALGRFPVLHPLVLDRPGEIIAAPYMDGIGVPTDDMSWRGREWGLPWSLDMPWVGLTDGRMGYLLLWELPVSCDNGLARLEAVKVGQKTLLAPAAWHYGIKGKFGPARTVRYCFCATGGHVALCKRYRQYALDHGFLRTQMQKLRDKPHLARLAGAPDVWGRSDLKFCLEAKAAGIDRLLVNGAQSAKDMLAIEALGYLISTYDNYEDAYQGDSGGYGDFKTATDALILPNGQPMTAWLTHDNPPKQFMKRCTELFEGVARKWIPRDLEQHPFNARFLDVTTACGLVECYSPAHPLDRTSDREARRRLAKYVGNELDLVLGGEHGRWWATDVYNYFEGMQSGNPFFSWPAGYVGEKIPQKREEIGQAYLDWGLGEKHRYPLWELVFHDCAVSTWYWGDSTGHLRAAAPELGYKQDAFNILYGTIPLYWVAEDYSYRWDRPETRARLLESYRNTCKLHEVVGFQEMVSHEFVTTDRAVQKTVFADGTQVWVNFGKDPWALQLKGQDWVLPQYGFYVKGPQIEQYRALKRWDQAQYRGLDAVARQAGGLGGSPDGRVTLIRKSDYLYVQGDVPGLVESCQGAGVTVKREGPARLRVISDPARWLRINWRALCPEAGAGSWRLVHLDAEGKPVRLGQAVPVRGDMLLLPDLAAGGVTSPCLLLGPRELASMTELAFVGRPQVTPGSIREGDSITAKVQVVNLGGKETRGVILAVYEGSVTGGKRLETRALTIPGGQTVTETFALPSVRYDNLAAFDFRVDDAGQVPQLCRTGNLVHVECPVAPDWALWDGHLDVTVHLGPVSRHDPVVEMPFDADAERAKLGLPGKADPGSVRVIRADVPWPGGWCPCQVGGGGGGAPKLVWRLPGDFEPGATVKCCIYLDGAAQARHLFTRAAHWDPDTHTFSGDKLAVQFGEGYIRHVRLQPAAAAGPEEPPLDLIANLGASSAATGWVDESGEVQSFKVLEDGPLYTTIRVQKKLDGGHSYDKLYTLYGDHFTVTVLSPDRSMVLSRAYYAARCHYQDSAGNKAEIDGAGDAEGVSGNAPGIAWYATWGQGQRGESWGFSCVAVTRADNVCYWDCPGAMAGLGFTHNDPGPVTMAYFLHGPEAFPAPDFARLDADRARATVNVER